MVVCASGSHAKSTTPDIAVITTDIMQGIPELTWLAAYLKYIQPLALIMDDFCAAEPPDPPDITWIDVISLATGGKIGVLATAIQKFAELLQYIAWYQYCECISGGTPSRPTGPTEPANPPLITTSPTTTTKVALLAADCRYKTLWTGSTNASPPADWYLPTFDDSSWSVPTPVSTTGTFPLSRSFQNGLELSGGHDPTQWGSQGLDPMVGGSSKRQKVMVRWRPVLPPLQLESIIVSWAWNLLGAEAGWTGGSYSVNGTNPGLIFNAAQTLTQARTMVGGTRNLISFIVDNDQPATPAIDLWQTGDYFTGGIEITGSAPEPFGTDCCARTEQIVRDLIGRLASMSDLVTLIQRQGVPFAYVAGTSHSGLTGSGELTVSGLIGAKVEPTTIPSSAGLITGDPDTLWLDSWVNWGNDDGWTKREFLQYSPYISLPRAAGQFTKIGYSLRPGLTVTITELEREP